MTALAGCGCGCGNIATKRTTKRMRKGKNEIERRSKISKKKGIGGRRDTIYNKTDSHSNAGNTTQLRMTCQTNAVQ